LDKISIINEIERVSVARQWLYEIMTKDKRTYKENEELRHGLDILESYQAGLEYCLKEPKEGIPIGDAEVEWEL
jgi:hypothetical protein